MITQSTIGALGEVSRFASNGPNNITNTKFKFKNGWTLSMSKGTQMGVGTYSTDTTVEVALFNPNDEMVPFLDGDTVKGYVDADTLVQIMYWAATQK